MVTKLFYYNNWADVLVVTDSLEVWHTQYPQEIYYYEYEGYSFQELLKMKGYQKRELSPESLLREIREALMQADEL